MNRSWDLGRAVASELAGKGKSPEKLEHALCVLAFLRINLRIGSFEIAVREHSRRPVAWTGNIDHIQIVFSDDPIQVDPRKCLARVRAPVPKQSILKVLWAKRLPQQGVVAQVDHASAEIIAGAPIRIDLAKFFRCKHWLGRG